jgi:predicted nucleotidyltransferase
MNETQETRAPSSAEVQLNIDTSTRARLDELRASLAASLGEAPTGSLVSLVVHGSAVRGGFDAATSDVDLVVVLKDGSRETLAKLSEPLQLARAAARIEAMILTERELSGAADVFPLLYRGIKRRNVVLFGADVFGALTIEPRHLRLRIEQELREAQIRLRRVFVDGVFVGEQLGRAVDRKVKQLRSPLRALLELCGVQADDTIDAVLAASATEWKVDTTVLRAPRTDPAAAYLALSELLEHAVDAADAADETPHADRVADAEAKSAR